MPEPIAAWWARRRSSRGLAVPYPVGSYREAWASYPVLVRQYRPEHNGGIVLSQIPPAADVWLCWLCDAGHVFVATPDEQRHRPGRERRRSSWCPECSELAAPRALPMLPPMAPAAVVRAQAAGVSAQGSGAPEAGSGVPGRVSPEPGQTGAAPGQAGEARSPGGAVPAAPSPPPRRRRVSSTGLPSTTPRAEATRVARPDRAARSERASRPSRASRPVCDKTPALPTGTPSSARVPRSRRRRSRPNCGPS